MTAGAHKKPGFLTLMARVVETPLGVISTTVIALYLLLAIFAPLVAPYGPDATALGQRLAPPSAQHWFGTDTLGRDILSRTLYGARVSLLVGLLTVMITATVGTITGALGGYFRGAFDAISGRFTELLLAFPYLLLAIIIVSALGPGIQNSIIAIAIWATPSFARVARSAVIGLREREFIDAARSQGARDLRIMTQHILPNFVSTLMVYASLNLANAVLMEAALSFLGLGVQPPTASWAAMIASGRDYIVQAPHIATIPGIFIALSVLGFNLLGDGLRDALDPRSTKT